MTIKATYTYAVPHTENNSFTDSVTAVAITQDAEMRKKLVAGNLKCSVDQVKLVNIEFTHEPDRVGGLAPGATAADVVGA